MTLLLFTVCVCVYIHVANNIALDSICFLHRKGVTEGIAMWHMKHSEKKTWILEKKPKQISIICKSAKIFCPRMSYIIKQQFLFCLTSSSVRKITSATCREYFVKK